MPKKYSKKKKISNRKSNKRKPQKKMKTQRRRTNKRKTPKRKTTQRKRKTQKRKTNRRKPNKRKTNKKKTPNKRKTNKRKTSKKRKSSRRNTEEDLYGGVLPIIAARIGIWAAKLGRRKFKKLLHHIKEKIEKRPELREQLKANPQMLSNLIKQSKKLAEEAGKKEAIKLATQGGKVITTKTTTTTHTPTDEEMKELKKQNLQEEYERKLKELS